MVAIMMVAFFACKKKSDTTTDPVLSASFSAKINGTAWTAVFVSAAYSGGVFTIAAAKNSDLMGLNMSGIGTGTYTFDNNTNWGTGTVNGNSFTTSWLDHPSGQIVITKWDSNTKLVSGTFSYEAYDYFGGVYHITEGQFSDVHTTTP